MSFPSPLRRAFRALSGHTNAAASAIALLAGGLGFNLFSFSLIHAVYNRSPAPDPFPLLLEATGVLFVISLILWFNACLAARHLLAGRSLQQAREASLQLALGAAVGDLKKQRFAESGLVCLLAALPGVLLTGWALDSSTQYTQLQNLQPTLNGPVLLYALAVTGLTAAVVNQSRQDLQPLRFSPSPSGRKQRESVVLFTTTVQIILSFLLLFTALACSLSSYTMNRHPNAEQDTLILWFNPSPPLSIQRELSEKLTAEPDIRDATWTRDLGHRDLVVNGQPIESVQIYHSLGTLNHPLVQGQYLSLKDDGKALISQSLAHLFPKKPGRLETDGTTYQVQGVLNMGGERAVFLTPDPNSSGPVQLRFSHRGREEQAQAALARLLKPAGTTPSQITRTEDQSQITVALVLLSQRISLAAAMLAMVLTGLGVYGPTARHIRERHREIAVHRALGAPDRAVVRDLSRGNFRRVLPGFFMGMTANCGLALLARMVFDIEWMGLLLCGGWVLAVMSGIVLAAVWTPVRRAVQNEPATLLRHPSHGSTP